MVRLYRTFSSYSIAGETRCARCLGNLSTPCYLCDVVVRVGSMRFAVLEPPRTIAEAPCTPCFPCKLRRFGTVEPPRTHVINLYTPCYLCEAVVLGSMRFAVLEPPRTSAAAPCTPCFPCNAVAREGSVQSNHPDLMYRRVDVVLIQCMMGYTQVGWEVGWLKPPHVDLSVPRCVIVLI